MDKAFFEAFKCFEPKTDTNNEDNPNTSFIECDINVKAQNTDISQEFDEQKIDIKSCKSMERISQILTYYIQWTNTIKSSNNTTPSIGMFDIINSGKYLGSYSNTQLLNDFHHILQIHNYDTINTLFINDSTDKQCILTTNKICQLLLRNYRNRNTNSMDNKQRKQLYYGSNISTEITTQQILDYIHCFIYHSYDLGFKLNPIYSSMYNDHLNNYKNQLLEVQNIEYSKTPQPPIFNNNINRKSIIYNQKIDINSLPNDASDSNSHSDSEETEDSLSVTPQPPEYDEKKDVTNIVYATSTSKSNKSPKLSSNLTPSLSPTNALINSNTFLKPGMDSMILSVPQTMQNMKETQSDNDSKLKQHLKLSNSKIIIIKQIMDQINDKSNQLCKNVFKNVDDRNNKKYINMLTSYKHLIYEFEPLSESISKKSDEEKKEHIISINTSLRHRRSSSADKDIEPNKNKKSTHSKSRSLARFGARGRSETEGIFKTKNFLKRNKFKKRTKTDAKLSDLPNNKDENMFMESQSPRSKYVNDSINDTENGGLSFDFGVRYYYWIYYKGNENKDKQWNNGIRYKYWYIESVQNNLKFEMLNLSQYNPHTAAKYKKSKLKGKALLLSKASASSLKLKNKLSLKDNSSVKSEKDEKDNNEIDEKDKQYCGMSNEQWNDIEQRAHYLLRTNHCKKIQCDLSIWCREYEINENDIIKKQHLIAILIFCTFNRIRNEFLLTFNQYYNTAMYVESMVKNTNNKQKLNKNKLSLFNSAFQKGIEAMKKNHSYFAHFGRLLRECVECFGGRMNENKSVNKLFYFGINNGLGLFKNTLSQFKLPLLCSMNINTVLNYMNINDMNDGLLVEMKYYSPFMRYFNTSFLTEFGCIENECIFVGGISMMKIATIISIFTEDNYKNFVRSINILQSMLMGKMRQEPMTENEQQIIRFLVQNEFIRSMNNDTDLSNNVNGHEIMPNYISLLFHHFCINLDNISVNLYRMNDKSFYGYFAIKTLFLTSQNNFIKLDVLCSLFPNVPTIKIIGDSSVFTATATASTNCIKLDELFFEEVLLILDSNLISNKCALKKIIIAYANEAELTLEQAIAQYQSQFHQKNCLLKIKVKPRELIIERRKKFNDNNNNNAEQNACLIQ